MEGDISKSEGSIVFMGTTDLIGKFSLGYVCDLSLVMEELFGFPGLFDAAVKEKVQWWFLEWEKGDWVYPPYWQKAPLDVTAFIHIPKGTLQTWSKT